MSISARYVWAYLPCHADREGRLKDSAFTLRAEIFPGEDVDMEAVLAELAERKHIIRYQVDGRRYIEIRNFKRYQNPHKNELPSSMPAPSGAAPTVRPEVVYFIRNTRNGMIKIGRSRMVAARLQTLQTGSPDLLELLGTVDGSEVDLHQRFAAGRMQGEWFAPSVELLDFIEESATLDLSGATHDSSRAARDENGTAPAVRSGPDPDPDPVGSGSIARARTEVPDPEPGKVPDLCRLFGRVRSREVGGLEWQAVPGEKAAQQAGEMRLQLEGDLAAIADIEGTMVLLFKNAHRHEYSKSGEILKSPNFAFAVWRTEFPALREQLLKIGPADRARAKSVLSTDRRLAELRSYEGKGATPEELAELRRQRASAGGT